MRNLEEQKKLTTPILWLFFLVVIAAAIVCVFFLPGFGTDIKIAGFSDYAFMDELEEVDEYDIDEGEHMEYIEKGTLIVVQALGEDETLEKNDLFAWRYQDSDGKTVIVTQVFVEAVTAQGGETTYISHDLDNMSLNSYNIRSGKLMGKVFLQVPKLGYAVAYINAFAWLKWLSLFVLFLISVVLPFSILGVRIKHRQAGSPFPEGVDITKLRTENLFIYENIRSFILSAGMKIEKGYDCDLIYIGRYLFAVLHVTNGNVYVNINKNFQRYDNKVDRAGYICIPHAASLETAKKRINSIYRAYFIDIARAEKKREQRMLEQSKAAMRKKKS